MANRPVVLSIAGYDPSSGAGITADVKTAAALGCFAVTCPTALTVQTTQGVFGMGPVLPEVVRETLNRLAEDVEITAVRVGMLGSGEIAKLVAKFFRRYLHQNVVLDPVIRSSSGAALIDDEGLAVIRKWLLPVCDVVTPNVDEAAELAGSDAGWESNSWTETLPRLRELANKLHDLGCRSVVITGGHLPEANDYLSTRDADHGQSSEHVFPGAHLESQSTHGTGCAFATALACRLAMGRQLPDAVRDAKEYVRKAIAASYPVGKGTGPINHLFRLEDGKL